GARWFWRVAHRAMLERVTPNICGPRNALTGEFCVVMARASEPAIEGTVAARTTGIRGCRVWGVRRGRPSAQLLERLALCVPRGTEGLRRIRVPGLLSVASRSSQS